MSDELDRYGPKVTIAGRDALPIFMGMDPDPNDGPWVHYRKAAAALASRDATIAELQVKLEACNEHAKIMEHERDWAQEVDVKAAEGRADVAEARCAELDRILRTDLHIIDAELLRIRNKCEGVDGDVKIWSRLLQMIVDAVRDARALSASPNREGRDHA